MRHESRGRPRGFGAFVLVGLLTQASLGWPFMHVGHPQRAALATGLFLVLLLLAMLRTRGSGVRWLAVAPAYLFLGYVALLRWAVGGSRSDYTPIVVLPVLWLALNGTRRQVWLAVGGVAVVLVGPALVEGGHSLSDLRPDVLWLAVAALTGPLTHQVVRQREAAVRRVALESTARHAAESELKRLLAAVTADEERFRTIFDNAPIGVTLSSAGDSFDPGPGTPVFLRVNGPFGRLLGRDPESLVGIPLRDIAVPGDLATAAHPGIPGERNVVQMRFLHASGRPIWCEVVYTWVRPPDGSADYYISHVQDITSRRTAERALLDALERQRAAVEALREADAVRTEVMSTVSHELRTPLTSIAGYIEVLAEDVDGRLDERQRSMLGTVERNADRLMALVDDLQVLARLDHTDPTADPWEPVRVEALVREAVEMLQPETMRREQAVEVEGAGLETFVLGDREQLGRALTNLLSNASKYSPPGGRITVTLRRAVGRVDIAVSDNGVGIPAWEVNRLFTRFFRASTATETGEQGTGLGLAIVKSMVEIHGGRVSVDSEQGLGSTFTIALPTVAAPVHRTPHTSTS